MWFLSLTAFSFTNFLENVFVLIVDIIIRKEMNNIFPILDLFFYIYSKGYSDSLLKLNKKEIVDIRRITLIVTN